CRRAERGHRVANAVLRERDDVHVAFHDERPARGPDRFSRLHEAVDLAALLEERRLGRIEILRLALAEHPAAEADRRAAGIEDREDDAVAKAVVALAVVLDDEPAFDERPVVVALERTLERSPSVRSIADAESRGD